MKIISGDNSSSVALTSLIILGFLNFLTLKKFKKLDDKVKRMQEDWKKERENANHKV